jgi:hypothetical protein
MTYEEVFGEFLHESDGAVLLDCNGDGEGVWIPKSQIEDLSPLEDLERGEYTTLNVTTWFAEKEGLA